MKDGPAITDVLSGRRTWAIACCDVFTGLRRLPDGCIHCVVTSPPYWGLRDYGTAKWIGGDAACDHRSPTMRKGRNESRPMLAGSAATNSAQLVLAANSLCGKCGAVRVDDQIGLESTPALYVAKMVAVFREIRRVLRDDGTLWLNIGDSYCTKPIGQGSTHDPKYAGGRNRTEGHRCGRTNRPGELGMKHKDLVGIPWMLAFALRDDGWYLRSEIIWAKPNPMTSSVADRPTRSHEQVFLFTKAPRYFYDPVASAEMSASARASGNANRKKNHQPTEARFTTHVPTEATETRLMRGVWWLPPEPLKDAHFAVMPTKLVRRCLVAGVSANGCCEACGSPQIRIVRKVRVETRPGLMSKIHGGPNGRCNKSRDPRHESEANGKAVGNRDPKRHVTRVVTEGWRPGCGCAAPTTTSIVLDPFNGAGTVPLVARRLGHRAIGFDLSTDYCEMATRRILDDSPLMNRQG